MLEKRWPIPTLSDFQHNTSSEGRSNSSGWVGRFCPISSLCVCVFVWLCAYSFLLLSKPCPGVFTCSQLEKWAVFAKHETTMFASELPVDLAACDSPAKECHGGLYWQEHLGFCCWREIKLLLGWHAFWSECVLLTLFLSQKLHLMCWVLCTRHHIYIFTLCKPYSSKQVLFLYSEANNYWTCHRFSQKTYF